MSIRQSIKNLLDNFSRKNEPVLATSEGIIRTEEKQSELQFQAAKIFDREKPSKVAIENNNSEHEPNPNNKDFRKKDKITLDLLVAVDQMMSDRELVKQNLEDVKERLKHSDDSVAKLQQEKNQLEQALDSKDSEIAELQEKISIRNLSYDQLMEDYQDLQSRLSHEVEELKNNIEIEQERYNKLNESYEHLQIENIGKVQKLEDKIRELETKNENLQKKYYQAREENSYLLGMFKDFNNRMSSSFKSYDHHEEVQAKTEKEQTDEHVESKSVEKE